MRLEDDVATPLTVTLDGIMLDPLMNQVIDTRVSFTEQW